MGTNKVQASLKGWSGSNPNSLPIPSSSARPPALGRAFFSAWLPAQPHSGELRKMKIAIGLLVGLVAVCGHLTRHQIQAGLYANL